MSQAPLNHNYVTVLLVQLMQPIVDVFETMVQRGTPGPNAVQASTVENGGSAAAVALAVLMLESACNRTKYVRGDPGRMKAKELFAYLRANDLAEDVEELFVVRDVIAHNHIWTADVDLATMQFRHVDRVAGYGDSKFNSTVDLTTRRTKRLGLDVFPTRIHRGTAVAVLKKLSEALNFLESIDRTYVYLTPQTVHAGGSEIPFYSWIDTL